MSTDANAALAWPIEITEFAFIGDKLVERKKTPESVRELWIRDDDQPPAHWEFLCGTDEPGNVRFDLSGVEDIDYAGARMIWSFSAMAWVCAPFIGDWLSDPLVREEGTETGTWFVPTALLDDRPDLFLPPDKSAFTVSHAQVCGVDSVTGAAACVCEAEDV